MSHFQGYWREFLISKSSEKYFTFHLQILLKAFRIFNIKLITGKFHIQMGNKICKK